MLQADIVTAAQFYDLDPMGVVWHGNYARFFELARCALLERIGYSYTEMQRSGYSWPVVEMRTKFIRPVKHDQQIRVTATLVEFENRLRIDYVVSDEENKTVLTRAQTTQVAVALDSGEMSFESPEALSHRVRRLL